MIIKEALEKASKKLEESNIENPLNEAKYLLKFLLKKDDIYFITNLNKELDDKVIKEYKNIVKKRCNHIPYSYITGKKEFMGLTFFVNEQTLIPRPETEIIVEYVINHFKNKKLNILEIGVGSGCISISIAKYLDNVNILGVDINKGAIEIANKNIKYNNVENKVKFIKSDLYENVEGKFDIIISNPPYIKSDVIDTLEDNVKKYEPILALDGGDDGLYFYRKIIENADNFLKDNSYIIFEIGYDQGEDVKNLLVNKQFSEVEIIKDLAGFDRTIVAKY